MTEPRPDTTPGLSCLLLAVALALLGWGGWGLYTALQGWTPREMTCAQYLVERPVDAWVTLTDCALDMTDATNEERVDGEITRLYVPAHASGGIDGTRDDQVTILVQTSDPDLVERYEKLAGLDQIDLITRAMGDTPELFVSYPSAISGLVQFGVTLDDDRVLELRRLNPALARDFVVLDEGARPQRLWSVAALVVGLLLIGVQGWLLRGSGGDPSPAPPPADVGSGGGPARDDGLGQAIRIEGLSKEFTKGSQTLRVLRGVDLFLVPGERVAIQGESGSGKSTFLQVLGTLDRPSRGRIWFGDLDVFARPPAELDALRNRIIGFVFQFHHLLPDHDALRNVMIPALIAGIPPAEAQTVARDLLLRVGLGERLHHRPGELSGGEQQRVAIARALVRRPTLILADEPTGNLDPSLASGVLDLLMELNAEMGSTLIVVTHSNELASRFNRRLLLVDGQFVELGQDGGEA